MKEGPTNHSKIRTTSPWRIERARYGRDCIQGMPEVLTHKTLREEHSHQMAEGVEGILEEFFREHPPQATPRK